MLWLARAERRLGSRRPYPVPSDECGIPYPMIAPFGGLMFAH